MILEHKMPSDSGVFRWGSGFPTQTYTRTVACSPGSSETLLRIFKDAAEPVPDKESRDARKRAVVNPGRSRVAGGRKTLDGQAPVGQVRGE